ncbi:hypothetical protein [Streptomyces sp. NPDC060205]|uniref:hypothetical protein n=1 Tax=Streptomyces sp. NPDC060205 TaxID=3347072 RepID=UPI00365D5365
MTHPPRICRHCDEQIKHPQDEALVASEPCNSVGARLIYAHVEHVTLLKPHLTPLSILCRLLVGHSSQAPEPRPDIVETR